MFHVSSPSPLQSGLGLNKRKTASLHSQTHAWLNLSQAWQMRRISLIFKSEAFFFNLRRSLRRWKATAQRHLWQHSVAEAAVWLHARDSNTTETLADIIGMLRDFLVRLLMALTLEVALQRQSLIITAQLTQLYFCYFFFPRIFEILRSFTLFYSDLL